MSRSLKLKNNDYWDSEGIMIDSDGSGSTLAELGARLGYRTSASNYTPYPSTDILRPLTYWNYYSGNTGGLEIPLMNWMGYNNNTALGRSMILVNDVTFALLYFELRF